MDEPEKPKKNKSEDEIKQEVIDSFWKNYEEGWNKITDLDYGVFIQAKISFIRGLDRDTQYKIISLLEFISRKTQTSIIFLPVNLSSIMEVRKKNNTDFDKMIGDDGL